MRLYNQGPCNPAKSAKLLSLIAILSLTGIISGCAGLVRSGTISNLLSIITSTLAAATTQTSYSAVLTASGGTAPYQWSISSGALPAGLSLAASTGQISGTPTQAGTSSFTAQVQDSTGKTATQALSIAVSAKSTTLSITTSSLPSGQQGTAYSATLTASGGTAPYSWSITSGSLPSGLSLTSSSGAIAGTPSAAGTYSFSLKVTDSTTPTAQTATEALSITIDSASTSPVSITTSSLPSGQLSTAYSTTLAATGGTTPYSWSISAGSLPSGLSIIPTSGVISGTPTASGTFSFTVKVTDSTTPAQTASKALSIVINTSVTPVSITTSSLASGTQGTAYSVTLAASGGTTPYTWSISSGVLPPGLSLTASTGQISGAPTGSGSFSFTVKVTDSTTPTAQTATQQLSISISGPATLSIITSTLPTADDNSAYTTTLSLSGGTAPYTWSISSGALPAGLSLAATTGVISGTPTVTGSFPFTAEVTDSTLPTAQTATANLTLSVTTTASYSVQLSWTASPSPGVTGYNVYRGTVSGGPYTLLTSASVAGLTWTDATVANGETYYYVTTSVDNGGDESGYSEEAQMAIP